MAEKPNSMQNPVTSLFPDDATLARMLPPVKGPNTNQPQAEHMGDPGRGLADANLNTVMQRLLQDFDSVKLFYPTEVSLTDPSQLPGRHPHLHFTVPAEHLSKMDIMQVNTYLSRHIDRFSYVFKRLGNEMGVELTLDDAYIEPHLGEFALDVKVPNPPKGKTEYDVLKELEGAFNEACKQARSQRQGVGFTV